MKVDIWLVFLFNSIFAFSSRKVSGTGSTEKTEIELLTVAA